MDSAINCQKLKRKNKHNVASNFWASKSFSLIFFLLIIQLCVGQNGLRSLTTVRPKNESSSIFNVHSLNIECNSMRKYHGTVVPNLRAMDRRRDSAV